MSTFEDKVTATYDFLANRASLNRVTNMEEVARVVAELLVNRQQRRIDTPIKREKVRDVLAEVDRFSSANKGVLLSSLVQNFWVDDVSSRFYDRARAAGVRRQVDFREEVNKAFAAFPEYYDVRVAHKKRDRLYDARPKVNLDAPRGGRHSSGAERDAGDYTGRRRSLEELAEELAQIADELASVQ